MQLRRASLPGMARSFALRFSPSGLRLFFAAFHSLHLSLPFYTLMEVYTAFGTDPY